MPGNNPDISVLKPVPVVVVPPGVLVSVQVPVAGKPFKTTLPVAREQFGLEIAPIAGAAGGAGFSLITTLAEAWEVQEVIPSVTV